jgi:sec-independent protein translocase protein TatA
VETIGPSELLIIFLVLVAIFGASRLPNLARGLGEGIREFRTALGHASTQAEADSDDADRDSPTNAAPPADSNRHADRNQPTT